MRIRYYFNLLYNLKNLRRKKLKEELILLYFFWELGFLLFFIGSESGYFGNFEREREREGNY